MSAKWQHNQAGWTFTGLLFVLLVSGIFLSVAFKLGPHYADHYTLNTIMEEVVADRQLIGKKTFDVEAAIRKHLNMNNMHLPKDFLSIKRDQGDVTLSVNYVIQEPLFYNVDALITFSDTYVGQPL